MIGLNPLREGDKSRKQLDQLQLKIAATRLAIEKLEHLPRARDEVRQALMGLLEDAKRRNIDPSYSWRGITRADGRAELPLDVQTPDLIYVLGEEVFADAILRRIEADPPPGWPGIPMAERNKKLAALRAELRDAEVAEEVETLRLEGEGHLIERRTDVDPAILIETWQRELSD